jgi:hypothetical protein
MVGMRGTGGMVDTIGDTSSSSPWVRRRAVSGASSCREHDEIDCSVGALSSNRFSGTFDPDTT